LLALATVLPQALAVPQYDGTDYDGQDVGAPYGGYDTGDVAAPTGGYDTGDIDMPPGGYDTGDDGEDDSGISQSYHYDTDYEWEWVPDGTTTSDEYPTSTSEWGYPESTSWSSSEYMTTTEVTSVVTTTSLLTMTTGYNTPGALSELPECALNLVKEAIKDNECDPSDMSYVCKMLSSADIRAKVATCCEPCDLDAYDKFVNKYCVVASMPPNATVIVTPMPPATAPPATAPPAKGTPAPPAPAPPAPAPAGIAPPAQAPPAPAPFNNGSAPAGESTAYITSVVVIPTQGPNGEPSMLTSAAVIPAPTGANPGPSAAQFTGAAVAVEAPQFLGSARAVFVGGVIGLMGLVFAEL